MLNTLSSLAKNNWNRPDRLWNLAKQGACRLIASGYVIEEARRNLSASDQLKELDSCLEIVDVVPELDPEIDSPVDLPDKDKPVLMAAIAAKADFLITGDLTHFGKYFGKTVMGVKISLARDYLMSFK